MATPTNNKVVREGPHELEKIIKSLTKASKGAVAKLVELTASVDEKIALEASKIILNTVKDMSESVGKERLQLILVNAKINGVQQVASDNTPVINFDQIQDV